MLGVKAARRIAQQGQSDRRITYATEPKRYNPLAHDHLRRSQAKNGKLRSKEERKRDKQAYGTADGGKR